MALTLIEAAKRTDDLVRQAIIELYASSSEVLRVLPFEDIQGNALRYNREETLPGIGFRGPSLAAIWTLTSSLSTPWAWTSALFRKR